MENLLETFAALVAIDSPSFGEARVCAYLRAYLERLGLKPETDAAGEAIGGDCGNLFVRVPGDESLCPLLFCTHMDTVEPSRGKRAVFHADGRITSAGDTVLGADDFAGVAAVLEALAEIVQKAERHPPLELLFTVAEEPYCAGVRQFDFSKCRAKIGYVFDLTGEIGTAAVAAPTIISLRAELRGRAAHAGFAPEDGVNAVEVAAKAMARIRQGRRDGGGTLNFGVISGGKAANIVPEFCSVQGEIRAMEHGRAMALLEEATAIFSEEAERMGAGCSISYDVPLRAYRADENGEAVRRFLDACKGLGLTPRLIDTFGGSDNAAICEHGIDGIVLASAMQRCHSTEEYTTEAELRRTAALAHCLMTGYGQGGTRN